MDYMNISFIHLLKRDEGRLQIAVLILKGEMQNFNNKLELKCPAQLGKCEIAA